MKFFYDLLKAGRSREDREDYEVGGILADKLKLCRKKGFEPYNILCQVFYGGKTCL